MNATSFLRDLSVVKKIVIGEPENELRASPQVVAELTALFRRNGYIRRQNPERLATAEYRTYKKGDEVRLVADTRDELRHIRRLLRAAGFKPGRAFVHSRPWRQPIYGRADVAEFLEMIGGEFDESE